MGEGDVPSKRTGSNVNDNATAPPSRRKASVPCPLPNRARFRARRRLGRKCRRMGHRPCFWVLPPLNPRNRVDGSLATLLRRECNGGMVGRTERVERLRDKRGGSPCLRSFPAVVCRVMPFPSVDRRWNLQASPAASDGFERDAVGRSSSARVSARVDAECVF
jgi:hypothetical protein